MSKPKDDAGGERLQKVIAAAGVASRRAAERLIEQGRVKVDGKVVTQLGTTVNAGRSVIEVDGKELTATSDFYYVLVHKPRGTICTSHDPEGRERVLDILPKPLPRVWTVGRLDYQTSGVILVTNDGDLTAALTHPSRQVARTYQVKLRSELSGEALAALIDGVKLADGATAQPIHPQLLDGKRNAWWYQLVLHEGRNREVRQLMEAVGAEIQKLHRASFGPLSVEGVRPGRFRSLEPEEVANLYAVAGLERRAAPQPARFPPRRSGRPGRRDRAKHPPKGGRPKRTSARRKDEPPKSDRPGRTPSRRSETPAEPARPKRTSGSAPASQERRGGTTSTGPGRKPTGPRKPTEPRKPTGPRKPTEPRKPTGPRKPSGSRKR